MTEGGLTLPEIARRGWRQWGYSSVDSAASCIRKALILDGLYGPRRCSCGCDLDERTRGCRQCHSRHASRRRAGRPNVKFDCLPCRGCGCHPDERTDGCDNCRWRHARRSYDARKAA